MNNEKGKLGINLNQIRRLIASDYTELCYVLNNSSKSKSDKNKIVINPNQIKPIMDNMRLCIAFLASSFVEGQDNFQVIEIEELPTFQCKN